jgi:hypothetical protein
MAEMVRFVVDVPKSDLMDLALNLSGDELPADVSAAQLAQYLKDAIIAGFEEYLGEETTIAVYPAKVT